MPVSLTFDECGSGIGNAWVVLRDNAARAGLGAAVPTCPDWTVRELVAHQGMVHRWATGVLRGQWEDDDGADLEREGLESPDLLAWFDDGARDLLGTLAFAPADLDVWFFLADAPAPRLAWARRQCHETTLHAVDAMSAASGQPPRATDTWVRPALATDGIDELLLGFLPRGSRDAAFPVATTLLVSTTDSGGEWTVQLGQGRVRAEVGHSRGATVDRVVEASGTAAQVYLGLWNRGDEMTVSEPSFLEAWRSGVAVSW